MSKILVVDDQKCILDLITETLVDDGHEVQTAGNMESGKELLMFAQPDLVLLDLYLDGPNGFALFEHIKRKYPRLPVIIVTAYDTFRGDPRLREAEGYVLKRIELWDELKQRVAEVLCKRTPFHEKSQRRITTPGFLMASMDGCSVAHEGRH